MVLIVMFSRGMALISCPCNMFSVWSFYICITCIHILVSSGLIEFHQLHWGVCSHHLSARLQEKHCLSLSYHTYITGGWTHPLFFSRKYVRLPWLFWMYGGYIIHVDGNRHPYIVFFDTRLPLVSKV